MKKSLVSFTISALAASLLATMPVGCGGGSGGSSAPPTKPVSAPDFALYDNGGLHVVEDLHVVPPGKSASFPINLVSENGWKQPVSLQISNIPAGWKATLLTSSYPSLPVGVTVDTITLTAPVGIAEFTPFNNSFIITATSGTVTRKLDDLFYENGIQGFAPTEAFVVRVGGISFSGFGQNNPFASAPPLTATNSTTGGFEISAAGITGPVTLKLVNNNPGITASFASPTLTPAKDGTIEASPEIDFTVSSTVGHGAYPITVTASDPKDNYTFQQVFNLDLFNVVADSNLPTVNLPSRALGSSASATVGVTINGYAGQIFKIQSPNTFNATPLPPGISVQFSPTTVTLPSSGTVHQNVTVTATVTGTATSGSYPGLPVGFPTADNPSLTYTAPFTIDVP